MPSFSYYGRIILLHIKEWQKKKKKGVNQKNYPFVFWITSYYISKTLALGYVLCLLAPYIYLFFFFNLTMLKDMWLLILQAEIEPTPSGLKEWSLNQWTTKEILILFFMVIYIIIEIYSQLPMLKNKKKIK